MTMPSISTALLFLCLLLPTTTTTTTTAATANTNTTTIISTLVGTGDFSNWAALLSSADPALIPFSATLFLPPAAANITSTTTTNTSVNLLYHIVPQRLAFSDLRAYPARTRLPTLVPGLTLLLTNTSLSNFTINYVPLTRPDLFVNAAVTVHAVAASLNSGRTVPSTSDQNAMRRRRGGPRKGRGRRHRGRGSRQPAVGPTGAHSESKKGRFAGKKNILLWTLVGMVILVLVLVLVYVAWTCGWFQSMQGKGWCWWWSQ